MVKQQTRPKTRTQIILDFLAANPDTEFRAHEVAKGIGQGVQQTANECARLARRGSIIRTRSAARTTGAMTITHYRASVGGSE